MNKYLIMKYPTQADLLQGTNGFKMKYGIPTFTQAKKIKQGLEKGMSVKKVHLAIQLDKS